MYPNFFPSSLENIKQANGEFFTSRGIWNIVTW